KDDVFFFFQAEDGIRDRNVTGVQTCALPIYPLQEAVARLIRPLAENDGGPDNDRVEAACPGEFQHGPLPFKLRPLVFVLRTTGRDRKSTRLNSSHVSTSYAVFCLHKKIHTRL